jgi:hypothetical protein
LATALAESEEPWKMPADYLRFIRTWYESNSRWDEAAAIAEDARGDPEMALFRFVNANSPCPFRLLGRPADAAALYASAGRTAAVEADETEKEILSMLGDGRLSSFCEEYSRHKEPDEGFPELADFLRGKTPEEVMICLGAFLYPERYVLPQTISTAPRERLESLKRLGAPPVSRSHIEDMADRFILPQSLTALFDREESYLEGAQCLEYLRSSGLLIPNALRAEVSGDISLADYEAIARVHCFGHSPEMIKTIDELMRELEKVHSSVAKDAAFILSNARNRKITETEQNYIALLSELFTRTRNAARRRLGDLAIRSMTGFILFAVIRLTLGLTGWVSDIMWAFLGFVTLLAAPALILDPSVFVPEIRDAMRRRELENDGPFDQNLFRRIRNHPEEYEYGRRVWVWNRGISAIGRMLGLFLVLYMVAFQDYIPLIIRALSLAFPIIGAFSGAGISFALYNYKMRRLWKDVNSACDLFIAAAGECAANDWRASVPFSMSDAGRR